MNAMANSRPNTYIAIETPLEKMASPSSPALAYFTAPSSMPSVMCTNPRRGAKLKSVSTACWLSTFASPWCSTSSMTGFRPVRLYIPKPKASCIANPTAAAEIPRSNSSFPQTLR